MKMSEEQARKFTEAMRRYVTSLVEDAMDRHNSATDSYTGCSAYHNEEELVKLLTGEET